MANQYLTDDRGGVMSLAYGVTRLNVGYVSLGYTLPLSTVLGTPPAD